MSGNGLEVNIHIIKRIMLFFILLLSIKDTFAQKQVSGTVKNVKGDIVVYASVVLKNDRGYILGFSQTNILGSYLIVLPDTPTMKQLLLEVNVLGYTKVRQQLEANKFNYHFVLEEQPIDLKEVEIKKKPQIISIGDTLSYDVASFSRPEDRSIGDVIRRLPGITVAENGQISYNGKTISNLYIHGDDLMDGRYGLATKAINKDMIKSIDVMQNHQPIKVLQNKVFTDDVAMNLVLKNENSIKLGGQAMLGGGLPEQYDIAFNGMMFNKVFKMLNSLQANNSGIDYRNDFEQLGTVLGAGNGGNATPRPLLSVSTVGNPDLPKANYYFNKSAVLNSNNLYNSKSGLQLKSNVQFFLDRNTMDHYSSFANYLPNDTINYYEQQHNVNKPYRLNLALTAMQNKQSYFLNNKLSMNLSGNKRYGYLNFNGNAFNQYLSDNSSQFSNDFSYTPSIKSKGIADFRWYISYFENPQTLNIDTGLNADVLNNGIPYVSISQYVKIPTLLSNATISYRIPNSGGIGQSYQLGMINEWQQLSSELGLTQFSGYLNRYANDVGNKLHWKRDKFFANATYHVKKEMWEAGFSVPAILQTVHYWQNEYLLNEDKRQFLLNPAANVRVYFNAEDYLRLTYNYQNLIDDVSSVYRGVILVNYRSIVANNAELQQRNVQVSTLYYNFQRSIIMLFINAALSYKKVEANSILSSIINNHIQQTVLLPYKNKQDMLSANIGLSKYIFALSTTVKLNGNWSQSRYDQFVNQTRLPFNNYIQSLSLGIDSKPFGTVTLDYQGIGSWSSSRPVNATAGDLTNSACRIEQGLNLGYSPISGLYLNVEGKNIYSSQVSMNNLNYFFLNAKVRYKFAKWRTDIALDLSNIMNMKKYEVFYLSSNQFAVNSYDIRGFMGVLRATFIL